MTSDEMVARLTEQDVPAAPCLALEDLPDHQQAIEIGRASCRERGQISVVAGALKKKRKKRKEQNNDSECNIAAQEDDEYVDNTEST